MEFQSELLQGHVRAVRTRIDVRTAQESVFVPQMLGRRFEQSRRIVVGVPQLTATFGTLNDSGGGRKGGGKGGALPLGTRISDAFPQPLKMMWWSTS